MKKLLLAALMRADSPSGGLGAAEGRLKINFSQSRRDAEEEGAKLSVENIEVVNEALSSELISGIISIHKYTQLEDTNEHKCRPSARGERSGWHIIKDLTTKAQRFAQRAHMSALGCWLLAFGLFVSGVGASLKIGFFTTESHRVLHRVFQSERLLSEFY